MNKDTHLEERRRREVSIVLSGIGFALTSGIFGKL